MHGGSPQGWSGSFRSTGVVLGFTDGCTTEGNVPDGVEDLTGLGVLGFSYPHRESLQSPHSPVTPRTTPPYSDTLGVRNGPGTCARPPFRRRSDHGGGGTSGEEGPQQPRHLRTRGGRRTRTQGRESQGSSLSRQSGSSLPDKEETSTWFPRSIRTQSDPHTVATSDPSRGPVGGPDNVRTSTRCVGGLWLGTAHRYDPHSPTTNGVGGFRQGREVGVLGAWAEKGGLAGRRSLGPE